MAIPSPEPGLVVHFNYLWNQERDEGGEEARYPRPCAVVLSYRRSMDGTEIALLAAITHAPPRADDHAIELPPSVKAHLGLDDQPSWVVLNEVNETAWPGFDLHPGPEGQFAYGMLPPALFQRIREGLLEAIKARRLVRVPW